jgi:hypothetical protein
MMVLFRDSACRHSLQVQSRQQSVAAAAVQAFDSIISLCILALIDSDRLLERRAVE